MHVLRQVGRAHGCGEDVLAEGPGHLLRAPRICFICIIFVQVGYFTCVEKGAPRVAARVEVLLAGEGALGNLRKTKEEVTKRARRGESCGFNIFFKRKEASKTFKKMKTLQTLFVMTCSKCQPHLLPEAFLLSIGTDRNTASFTRV